jgi:hypothetical protein
MVAVGEIEYEMLSKFQSRVHSHLQGLQAAARSAKLYIGFQLDVTWESQYMNETGGKIERTHPKTSNFLPLITSTCKPG